MTSQERISYKIGQSLAQGMDLANKSPDQLCDLIDYCKGVYLATGRKCYGAIIDAAEKELLSREVPAA